MTLLFMDGMDLHGVTANLSRRYDGVGTTVIYSTTSGRFGGGGIRVGDDDRYLEKAIAGTPQTSVVSFALFREGIASDAIDKLWRIDTSVSEGGIVFKTSVASSIITVHRGPTTNIGSFTIGIGEWHWVSIKTKMSNTVGTVDVEVDGINVFSFAGDTVNSGTETCNSAAFGGQITQNFTYDDLIITDVAGSAPFNDLLSDRRIDTIQPDAAGDSAGFTASPAVANYLNVDEASPDDDTTYVEAETSALKDLYNMASMGFSPASIDAVNVVVQAKNPDAGGTQLKLKVKSGTTEGTGAAQTPTSGYTVLDEHFLTNPDTASAWTESEVNGMQAGQEIV